jgi:hypothetical protein
MAERGVSITPAGVRRARLHVVPMAFAMGYFPTPLPRLRATDNATTHNAASHFGYLGADHGNAWTKQGGSPPSAAVGGSSPAVHA